MSRAPARQRLLIAILLLIPPTLAAAQDSPAGPDLLNSRPPFLASVLLDRGDHVYEEGETFSVRLRTERDAFLYLLYHQADKSTVLLFPNPARSENHFTAAQTVHVPAAGDRFRFRVRAPLGQERLQVLAASRRLEELDQVAAGGSPQVPPAMLRQLAERLGRQPDSWAEHRVELHTVAAGEPRPRREPTRAGLFIGIGRYQDSERAATHEELGHSAGVMHQAMLERGKLDPDRTALLRDERATREAIRQAIVQWLPSVTQPGDTVFIYFSGHAAKLPTPDGSEPDRHDELLCPYDYDAGDARMTYEQRLERLRETNISDNALARWLEELQGRQVVLILDTCHSGGFAAGKNLTERAGRLGTRLKDIAQLNTVILTSCQSDEQALFEGTPNQTMWFTYFLAQAVEDHPSPLSLKDAYEYVRRGMAEAFRQRNEVQIQRPMLVDNALLPVFLVP